MLHTGPPEEIETWGGVINIHSLMVLAFFLWIVAAVCITTAAALYSYQHLLTLYT